jgi:RNA polymerase sigma factor (sigma-70 family)
MRRLHDLWRRGRRAARSATSDAELLDRFARDGDHSAFAELVDRLGPLVYGACRRLLPNPADVEDAFQATFLVLVRRAATITGRPVGPWLHRVAVWTARNFRRRTAKAPRSLDEATLPGSAPDHAGADARLDIDAAVSALPEKYRTPVVLCHLQGWTRRELAAHLGCPESTASSLVGRGLAKLRRRLAGRDPAVALAVAGASAVPAAVAASAVRAACLYRSSSLAAAASPAVAQLTEGVLRMFGMKKWPAGLAAAVAVVGLGLGLTAGGGQRVEAQAPAPPRSAGPADDLTTHKEKLDKELAAARDRLRQLEDQKARLQQLAALREGEKLAGGQKKAAFEPHIGVWVRPPNAGDPLGFRLKSAEQRALALTRDEGPGLAWRSEFAINEFTGPGKPVVEAHFYDVRSLQTYLTRAAKDPAAPKKLKLDIDKDYPAAKVKAVLDACKAAGFATVELVSGPAPAAPANAAPPAAGKPAVSAAYVIEPPDVLSVEATVRGGDKSVPVIELAVTGQYIVRPDGTISLEPFGSVKVVGLRPTAAADAVRKHLVGVLSTRGSLVPADAVEVRLDVAGANSKRYYVIVSEGGKEEVFSLPCTGNETVLGAFSGAAGLADRLPGSSLRLARKTGKDGEPYEVLPIDWEAITRRGETTTNYQLLPGDRLYVLQKK